MERDVRFGVLGTLCMSGDGETYVPRGPKLNTILALLLLRANQVVEVDAIVDELWDGNPPRRALETVRTHIYHLRRLLTEQLGIPGDELLAFRPPGYLITLDREQLDALRFTALAREARTLLAGGEAARAAATASAALGLWRGPALANVNTGRRLAGHVQRLEELRVQTLDVSIEAELALGRHRELIPELRDLVAQYPLNERFHIGLVEALLCSGRRAEALHELRELHRVLNEELGLGPSARLLDLESRILAEDGVSAAS